MAQAEVVKEKKKDYATILMVSSKSAEVTRLFPVIKQKEGKIITSIHLEKSFKKELTFQQDSK